MDTCSDPVTLYARSVTAGEVSAGRFHVLACKRHLSDLEKQSTPGFPYRWVWEERDAAGKLLPCAVRFLEFAKKIRHYKGEGEAGMKWAGKFFEPSENQVFRLGSIFGWRRTLDGLRRFTTAYQEMPRKSGKTFENGIIGIYVTFFEGEPGAEGVSDATKRQQARRVFDDMVKFIKASGLKSRLRTQAGSIHCDATSSKFEPLGKDFDSVDGLNLHCIVTDEYHAHKTNDLVDVLESSTGARRNPLHSMITTAGDDPISPCGKMHDYACKILEGLLDDEATQAIFGFIASADPGDDWQLESTWKKANPQWGISVLPTDLRKRALEAKNVPSKAAEFRQKRLNEWINASAACLSVDGWRRGQNPAALSREAWLAELDHAVCFAGIDLASKLDLCALSLVFPPAPGRASWRVIQRIWTPAETLVDRAHRDRAPYGIWRDQGWLTATEGTQIDHQLIRAVLIEAREKYDLHLCGFDPWHADTLVTQLKTEDGFGETQVLGIPQTYGGMSSACLKMQAEIASGTIDAFGCPVTAWSVSNVVDNHDGKGNLMFAKGKSRGRIDPVISATIGMSLALKFGWAVQPKPRRRGVAKIWQPGVGFVPAVPEESQPHA